MPVHYAGVGCEMDAILDLATRTGSRSSRTTRTDSSARTGAAPRHVRRLATQSFHETKNITCGEGGALLINDPRLVERAEIIREKGTNRSRFFRGQVDKYTWVDVGSSYLPSDILAAFLFAQLEARERIQATRRRLWDYYAGTCGTGPRRGTSSCRASRPTASRRTTCSTCCSRRSSSARR